jgi:hypothetical protein
VEEGEDWVASHTGILAMPTISTFFGITIRMYYDDHGPPHFHAMYAGMEAKIGIEGVDVMDGGLPRRALGLVLDWAETAPLGVARELGEGGTS